MDIQAHIREIEERFWTASAAAFEACVAQRAVFVLPSPAGVMSRREAIEGLRSAPRWNSVELRNVTVEQPADNLATIAYEAAARRGNKPLYRALVGSVYLRDGDAWKLVFHQQTPVDPPKA